MIMQMMMSHDEPGSKHQITVKKKKKSKMNDNAFRDKENWTNLQLRPKKHTTFDSFFWSFSSYIVESKVLPRYLQLRQGSVCG